MTAAVLLWAACLGGCAYCRVPRIDPSGERIFAQDQPRHEPVPEGQREWDNVELLLTPRETIAPVGSDVALVASVVGPDRYTSTNERVEWSVAPGSVGEIVEVGQGTWTDLLLLDFTRPRKVNATWAVTSTSRKYTRLTRGTPGTGDDVCVKAGQAWATVSSPVEGTSYVTAFAPSVYGWDRRRETAAIHWVDAQWTFPPPAINPAGTRHVFTTTVSRHTDQSPHVGWLVRYEIADGPAAGFAPDGSKAVEVATNELGQASVEIFQPQASPGTNRLVIQVIRPATKAGPEGKRLVVGTGGTTKTWSAPKIALRKTGPAAIAVGGTLQYVIEVSNPGDLPAEGVVVADQIPDGAVLVGSNPAAQPAGRVIQWQIGQLGGGQARRLEVHLRAEKLGTLTSCAEAAAAGGLQARDCATTTVTAPGVELKVTGPTQVTVGDSVRFDIVVTNRGQATATNLVVRDRFDPGLRHATATDRIEAPLPADLPPGAYQNLNVTFQAVQAGQLCHTVEVLGAGGVLATQQACVTAVARAGQPPAPAAPQPAPPSKPEVKPAPAEKPVVGASVSIAKTGPATAAVGDKVIFTIDVANSGTQRLTGVRVFDQCDPQLVAVQATEGFERVAGGVAIVIDQLAPGDRAILEVQYECRQAAAKVCTQASVTSAQGVRHQAEACLAITAGPKPGAALGPPNLVLEVTDTKDPVSVGGDVTYRITVTNQGQTADATVAVSVLVPQQMLANRLGVTGPAPCDIDGQTIRFKPVPQIRPGETLTYRVRVTARAPGDAELVCQVVSQSVSVPKSALQKTVVTPKL